MLFANHAHTSYRLKYVAVPAQ